MLPNVSRRSALHRVAHVTSLRHGWLQAALRQAGLAQRPSQLVQTASWWVHLPTRHVCNAAGCGGAARCGAVGRTQCRQQGAPVVERSQAQQLHATSRHLRRTCDRSSPLCGHREIGARTDGLLRAPDPDHRTRCLAASASRDPAQLRGDNVTARCQSAKLVWAWLPARQLVNGTV